MVVDAWNRVNEDATKDDKKYDYKSLSFEKAYANDVDNVSDKSSNIENGIYKATTIQNKRKNTGKVGFIALSLALIIVIIWLLVLTLIREQQIKSLKENLRDLRSDVDILKKRLLEDDLIEDVKAFEDAIYADQNPEPDGETDGNDFFINDGRPSDEIDDDELDDEDMVAESGDWAYDDEDGDIKGNFDLPEETEEILGEVLEGRLNREDDDTDDEDMVKSRKVLRILKETEDNNQERPKREVIDHTKDGVLVLSEPYRVARVMNESVPPDERTRVFKTLESADRQSPKMLDGWEEKDVQYKRRKNPHPKKYYLSEHISDAQRQKTTPMDSSSDSSTPHPSLSYRRSRVMKTDEDKSQAFRRIVRYRRPLMRSGDYASGSSDGSVTPGEYVRLRRRRKQRPSNSLGTRNMGSLENLDDVELYKGPLEGGSAGGRVAHFHGDTSGYMIGRHEHYDGNGRLRHPHDTPYTAWKAMPWVRSIGADKRFQLDDFGAVTIAEEGIYLIYAQILYHDEHDLNSYKVYRSRGSQDETLLLCTTTVTSTSRMEKASTCFTSAAVHLRAGDKVSIKNLGSMRYSIMESGKSFFGFVKLTDIGQN